LNLKLGNLVNSIRKGRYSDKKTKLIDLGFIYNPRPKFTYENVKIAVLTFRSLYHISVDIPDVYNIPFNDGFYPEETWGLSLGRFVYLCKFTYMYIFTFIYMYCIYIFICIYMQIYVYIFCT
jgi:hypothetical protein